MLNAERAIANSSQTGKAANRLDEAKALRKMRHPTRIRQLEGFIELPGA